MTRDQLAAMLSLTIIDNPERDLLLDAIMPILDLHQQGKRLFRENEQIAVSRFALDHLTDHVIRSLRGYVAEMIRDNVPV